MNTSVSRPIVLRSSSRLETHCYPYVAHSHDHAVPGSIEGTDKVYTPHGFTDCGSIARRQSTGLLSQRNCCVSSHGCRIRRRFPNRGGPPDGRAYKSITSAHLIEWTGTCRQPSARHSLRRPSPKSHGIMARTVQGPSLRAWAVDLVWLWRINTKPLALELESLSSFLTPFLRSSAFQHGWFETRRNLETQRKRGAVEVASTLSLPVRVNMKRLQFSSLKTFHGSPRCCDDA